MKTLPAICAYFCILFCICLHPQLSTAGEPKKQQQAAGSNPQIDYPGFVKLTRDVQQIRKTRLIPIATFNEMSRDRGTIILDTRSKAAFDGVHVQGAVHLNFSDFSVDKLAKVIPSKHTRILIYCNNNFVAKKVPLLLEKRAPLALNIPTFVNLHGYSYENVYELADALELNDTRVKLVGTRAQSIADLAAKQSRR